ncbi:thrombospondin type-1 domain-containing protein 7A-like, partial [Stegodyphus dumicola]|uniref:thrombospondin type-1 domain-containing protein 7A-like n=1 Tax=Stegodyphus dumicola TaxID=202533 RepID=UPI0015A9B477
QYRHRIVLQASQNGGKACPDRLEARPCSSVLNCLEPSNKSQSYMKLWNIDDEEMRLSTYEWNTGEWSECQIPVETQQCGIGFQIRNVSCIDNKTALVVEPHLCLTASKDTASVPSAVRSCEITCSPRCVLTTWCSWTECVYGYKSRRSRGRELVDAGESNTKCLQHKLSETEDCPVFPPVQTGKISDIAHWLSCIVDEANMTLLAVNGRIVRHACGEGYRYKAGVQMNSKLGIGPGLEKDFCWVDCPIDCQMSEWSEWSTCDVPCGKGFRERRRQVVVPANQLGRPCLGTVDKMEIQRDVCYIPCSDFKWSVKGWSHCKLDDNESSGCGNGTRYRTIKCLDQRTEQEVEEIKCDPLHKPTSVERCRIHCPGECVLSSWSVWKECSEPCSSDNFLEMHRTIMRHPNSTADSCPSLISRTPCILNKTCHHYRYEMGPWGSCILPEGALCGEGVQKRPLLCLRSDGRQVDAIQCEKSHKPMSMKEPVSKPCYVDCPLDCVMSEWSAWNDSECSACGSPGVMIRKRYILQLPTDSGQPCPPEVEQRKPCPFIPCYHWKYSDWSTCDLEGADCGYGVRRRVVECIRYDGLQVDKIYCLTVNATFPSRDWLDPSWLALAHEESQEEQICHVPCPGDCIMTEWTKWSHCQKNCRIGQTFGYKTSSRKILYPPRQTSDSCPVQLWRTRPCWTDDCGFFRWKVKNDSLICVGRYSVVVEGGCTSEPRPCLKNCEELGGRCDPSTGLCHCLDAKGHVVSSPSSDYSERCVVMSRGPHPPANHSAPTPEIRLKYYPDDSQVSFWMYAMISIGTAFVIFVAVTVYLMCRSSLRQRSVSVERQPSLRRRTNVIKQTKNHSSLEDAAIHSNNCSL